MSTTLTIDLPDELAARAKSAAGSEAVLDWIARGVTETPVEQPSDAEVSRAAAAVMPTKQQAESRAHLADQREGRLTAEGRVRLDQLMAEYRRGLLAKAKAVNEAVRRGLLAAGGGWQP